jgi:hypothetical protein
MGGRSQNTVLIRAGSPTHGISRQSRDSQTSPPTNRSIAGLRVYPIHQATPRGQGVSLVTPPSWGAKNLKTPPSGVTVSIAHIIMNYWRESVMCRMTKWNRRRKFSSVGGVKRSPSVVLAAPRKALSMSCTATHVFHVIHMLCTVIQSYQIRP